MKRTTYVIRINRRTSTIERAVTIGLGLLEATRAIKNIWTHYQEADRQSREIHDNVEAFYVKMIGEYQKSGHTVLEEHMKKQLAEHRKLYTKKRKFWQKK